MIREIEKIKRLADEIIDLNCDLWDVVLVVKIGKKFDKKIETVRGRTSVEAFEGAKRMYNFYWPTQHVIGFHKIKARQYGNL